MEWISSRSCQGRNREKSFHAGFMVVSMVDGHLFCECAHPSPSPSFVQIRENPEDLAQMLALAWLVTCSGWVGP